jgi:hypothetical protein
MRQWSQIAPIISANVLIRHPREKAGADEFVASWLLSGA